jgi:hypothetical protein
VKDPIWFTEATARTGKRIIAGEITRTEAVTELALAVHGDLLGIDIVTGWTNGRLDAWLKAAQPAAGPGIQATLFPELKRSYRTTPSKYVDVAAMTAHDVDMARAILWAKTQNAIDGAREAAEHERAVFAAFEEKVRPLLAGSLTVADVLDDLEEAGSAL